MAAVIGTLVTATSLSLNAGITCSLVLATNGDSGSTTTDTETFEITSTRPEAFGAVVISNYSATTATEFNYKIVAGSGANAYWAAGSDTDAVTIPGGANGGNVHVINLEGAKFKKTDGTISVKLTLNQTGTALDAIAKVGYIQLP